MLLDKLSMSPECVLAAQKANDSLGFITWESSQPNKISFFLPLKQFHIYTTPRVSHAVFFYPVEKGIAKYWNKFSGAPRRQLGDCNTWQTRTASSGP